jgi:hypothetical protein
LVSATGSTPRAFSKPSATRLYGAWAIDLERAAVQKMQLTAETEFIALCTTSKVVVVVQNQDLCGRSGGAVKTACGESADTATNNDEIVALAGILAL